MKFSWARAFGLFTTWTGDSLHSLRFQTSSAKLLQVSCFSAVRVPHRGTFPSLQGSQLYSCWRIGSACAPGATTSPPGRAPSPSGRLGPPLLSSHREAPPGSQAPGLCHRGINCWDPLLTGTSPTSGSQRWWLSLSLLPPPLVTAPSRKVVLLLEAKTQQESHSPGPCRVLQGVLGSVAVPRQHCRDSPERTGCWTTERGQGLICGRKSLNCIIWEWPKRWVALKGA